MLLWTVLMALCAFCVRNVAAMCEPVKAPMCANMPYNLTEMPNAFHHTTQENAMLAIEQFQPLVNTGCSGVLSFFLCTMYFPVCAAIDSPLRPCRSLCEEAKQGCLPIMMRYNVSWPENLACEELPEYKQGLCIMPETIVHDPSSTPPKDVIIAQSKPELETDDDDWRRPGGRRRDRKERRKQEKKERKNQDKHQDKDDKKRKGKKEKNQARKEERRQKRQRRREERKGDVDIVAEDLVEDGDGSTKAPAISASAPCVCQPPRQIKKELKTNPYTYKIKAAWAGLERTADGTTLMKFKLLETFTWPNEGYLDKGEVVTIQTNKTCICPRFKEERHYLVAGYGAGANLQYDVALKWKPIFKKVVEKSITGKKESKKLRKERKQKQKQERRRQKQERKQKQKEERRKNRRKNRKGAEDEVEDPENEDQTKEQKREQKKEMKKRRKEERKERRKEKKRRKWGTTEVPLLEWMTTDLIPHEKAENAME